MGGGFLSELAEVRFATSGQQALALCRQNPPDLMLLDAQLGEMDGLQVLQQLQASAQLAEVAVIFVTSHGEEALEVAALDQGAVDYVTKPVRAATLRARVRTHLKLHRLTRELRAMASQDGLTGVGNRRAFDQALEHEWRLARRQGSTVSLLMVDVDYFKRFNDRYGHIAGDECLRAVAAAMRQLCRRPGDLVARYGGEEFAMLLPNTEATGAQRMAAQVLQKVAQLDIANPDSDVAPHVTVSIGWVSEKVGADTLPGALLHKADAALYQAKSQGRARACSSPELTPLQTLAR
jgi:diguanylate cyclase (GGDEF)-like protein